MKNWGNSPAGPHTLPPTLDELRQCAQLLEKVAQEPLLLAEIPEEERLRFVVAAGRVSRPGRAETRVRDKALRLARRQEKQAKDRSVRAATQIRKAREAAVFEAPAQ